MYLLCEAWLNEPRATLPDDEEELAEMARVTPEKWSAIKAQVMKCFHLGTCQEHLGLLYNDLQLSVSCNYNKNQRFGNKNARKTRTKREPNAEKRIVSVSVSASASASLPENKDTLDRSARECDSQILSIWEAYPKKVGKAPALKAIKAALKKVPAEELLSAVKKYATQRHGKDAQFTAHPATWFNQERWSDEDAPETRYGISPDAVLL